MIRTICLGLAVIMGIAAVANGLFMLVAPGTWYFAVPGVTTTGPFNQHFIRDIGLIFLLMGGCFLIGAGDPRFRVILWGAAALWLTGHASFHLWEVGAGISEHSAMARDFPAVTLPAIVAIAMTAWALRAAPAGTTRQLIED